MHQFSDQLYQRLISSFLLIDAFLNDDDIKALKKLSVASPYAAEQIIKSPIIYLDWKKQREKNLVFDVSIIKKDIASVGLNEFDIKQFLRQKRHFFLTHIVLNDVCLNFPVEIILEQISALADSLINAALDHATLFMASLYGMPTSNIGEKQPLMVVAMGKLGGGELNFSSDIDLIFVYAEDGLLPTGKGLSYREFYIKVGRLLSKLLNDVTKDGFVYRVDLRLRPWGESGPIVISIAGLENYYQSQGRDWERYALVKARVLSGSDESIKSLDQVIKPFVYRKYHDFNVFSGLGSLKLQIDKEAKKKQQKQNIKLFSGGIREIEFCIQALQILMGGRHKKLQNTSILAMFEMAKNESFYSAEEIKSLKRAYLFFRCVENRIQMIGDKQTHSLPMDNETKERLLCSLEIDSWGELSNEIEAHKKSVHGIFKELFIEKINTSESIDFSILNEEEWQTYCEEIGLDNANLMAKKLLLLFKERAIVGISNKGRARLNELLPNLLKLVGEQSEQEKLLNKLTELLLSIARRSVYLELMAIHQPLLEKLILLFAQSSWLSEEVIRYPILLESVLIPTADNLFDKEQSTELLNKELGQVNGDVEMELDVLRVFKRQQVFQIALNELDQKISPLTASAALTELAMLLLQASYELSLSSLIRQFGRPHYELGGVKQKAEFAIIGYGKLGGQELHYTSDLDVIFLHDSCGEKQITDGKKPIDNAQFFVRLAQKITSTIGLLTSSGRLYEIDARLRPNGASGFLVSSLQAYEAYQMTKAWAWEHQALVRSRFVAGNESFNFKFEEIKCAVLNRRGDLHTLSSDVQAMRLKMLGETPKEPAFNLKKSLGGMIDIEFMVQYFVLTNSKKLSSLCQYSANIPLLRYLYENGCIDAEFLKLIPCYEYLHRELHMQVLHQLPQSDPNEQMLLNIAVVKKLWQRCFQLKD